MNYKIGDEVMIKGYYSNHYGKVVKIKKGWFFTWYYCMWEGYDCDFGYDYTDSRWLRDSKIIGMYSDVTLGAKICNQETEISIIKDFLDKVKKNPIDKNELIEYLNKSTTH